MLVAAGVSGELLFGFWVHRKENKLRAISGRLEVEANERIADAERRTAEAVLETEKLKAQFAWRSVPTEKAHAQLDELRAGTGSVWIEYMNGDPESLRFAQQFVGLFSAVKWTVGLRGGTGNDLAFGVIIPSPAGESAGLTAFIAHSFLKSGIGFNIAPLPRWVSSVITMPPPPELGRTHLHRPQAAISAVTVIPRAPSPAARHYRRGRPRWQ